MGRLEVQGIVSSQTGEPLVQFRQLDDDGKFISGWQADIIDAREMAQEVIEAVTNAVYDAALIAWTKEMWPDAWEDMAAQLLPAIRSYRADRWGLPDNPDDWR
jgi:hypothetical protein